VRARGGAISLRTVIGIALTIGPARLGISARNARVDPDVADIEAGGQREPGRAVHRSVAAELAGLGPLRDSLDVAALSLRYTGAGGRRDADQLAFIEPGEEPAYRGQTRPPPIGIATVTRDSRVSSWSATNRRPGFPGRARGPRCRASPTKGCLFAPEDRRAGTDCGRDVPLVCSEHAIGPQQWKRAPSTLPRCLSVSGPGVDRPHSPSPRKYRRRWNRQRSAQKTRQKVIRLVAGSPHDWTARASITGTSPSIQGRDSPRSPTRVHREETMARGPPCSSPYRRRPQATLAACAVSRAPPTERTSSRMSGNPQRYSPGFRSATNLDNI
jgi:hypothetical protein